MKNVMKGTEVLKPADFYTYTRIKCCLAFLLVVIFPCNSFATAACVSNDTRAVILDYSVTPNSGSYRFKNACLSSNFGYGQLGLYKQNNGILIDKGKVVVGGETNASDTGLSQCWCKIIYPVVSYWFLRDWDTTKTLSQCNSECSIGCRWVYENYGDLLRKHIFNSIEN